MEDFVPGRGIPFYIPRTCFYGYFLDIGERPGDLSIKKGFIGVGEDGFIDYIGSEKPTGIYFVWVLSPEQLFMPGFVDTHVHAAQVQYAGTGTDLPLMQWLERYAFPSERRLGEDLELALSVYTDLSETLLQHGTTTALLFGVLDLESCKVLVKALLASGQRAFVGKVAMDRLAPADYCETTAEGLARTEEFIEYVRSTTTASGGLPLIEPVVTPRFVPCCTEELLVGLGEIAQRHGCAVQSHVVESVDCLATVQQLHPGRGEVEILESAGLVTPRCVLAHAVHLSEAGAESLHRAGTAVAHCPLSNHYFAGGCLRTAALMDKGLKVGLGTDIAGGYSPSMLSSIRHCVTTHLAVADADAAAPNCRCAALAPGAGALSWRHAVWLATVGGAKALGIEDRVGKLQKGFAFDALLVDLHSFSGSNVLERFEKWVHLGDDRQIGAVWVQGRRLLGDAAPNLVSAEKLKKARPSQEKRAPPRAPAPS